jgi:phage baseplate assembly protein V
MANKNLLADTDFAKGWDNRFGTSVHLGVVSKIECTDEHANVRVLMPDKVDHEGTPLNTKPIPVLQVASTAKRQFTVPRIDDLVVLVKLPYGTSNYFVLGSFYSKKNPPPVTDPNLDYVVYDDGSVMQFNASTGEQLWQLKGKMTWENEKGAQLTFGEAVIIETTGSGITIKAGSGTVTVEASHITLKGPVLIQGDITHIGNMTTTGVHIDANGVHT